MLAPILGSKNCERVLIFVLVRKEGYGTEIARFFDTDLFGIQQQLDKLESGGVLVSRNVGRTRIFTFNPRYPLLKELISLLEKAYYFYPEVVRDGLLMNDYRQRGN